MTAKLLHDTAMDFYDLANIAKAKGNEDGYLENMRKALAIEREAAFKFDGDYPVGFWPVAYFRSAAWMAYYLKDYQQARALIQFAYAGEPSEFEKHRLQEVEVAVNRVFSTVNKHPTTQVLTGFLMSIDLIEKKVVLLINGKPTYQAVELPPQLKLRPLIIGQLVVVEIKTQQSGKVVLQQMYPVAA